ncbi:MAG: mycothiol synthase [Pseudorhodobacter sp.]|nr:mycothiol synthase [Frankiaceae bacterium]
MGPDQGAHGRALVEQILGAAAAADGQDPVDESVRLRLRHHGLRDSTLWLVGEDGFALRHGGDLDLVVAPQARGRGIGATLATAALARPGPIAAWSHGDHPAARRIGVRLGMRPTRSLWVMRRGLGASAEPLPPLQVPEAITVRGFRPDDPADAAAVLRVNAAAFAHHPEQGSLDQAGLDERLAEPWFDPAGLLLAEDATGVLGFHWTKRHSPTLGEVYVVGIDPATQGRGLGRMLTLAGLHHLADGGSTDVLLYVESDNAPAIAVYSRLGFTHLPEDTHLRFTR